MTPTGIPTVYRGRQYRSRLEARWAAFFDLLGWAYEYEPFDLRGWIPDFLLTAANVLVEVKPVSAWPAEVMAELDGCRGADDYEILVAGCTVPVAIHPCLDADDGVAIGWLRATPPSWGVDRPRTWCGAVVQKFGENVWSNDSIRDEWQDVGVGLYSSRDHILRADPGLTPPDWKLGTFAYNRFRPDSGIIPWGIFSPGDPFTPSGRPLPEFNLIRDLWSKAGNLTQWKGRQSVVS